MRILSKLLPFIKEGASTACIMTTGDAIAQLAIERKPLSQFDGTRAAKFAFLGFTLVGPTLRVWYSTLDRFIAKDQAAFKRVVKKVAVDQLCFAPLFTLVFLSAQGKLTGQSTKQIRERISNDYVDIMKNGYMLWPATQIINFQFIPLQYQVIFVQIVAVIWNTYLSTKLNKQQ